MITFRSIMTNKFHQLTIHLKEVEHKHRLLKPETELTSTKLKQNIPET